MAEIIIVWVIVGAAGLYLAVRLTGALRGKDGGCGGSCRCASPPAGESDRLPGRRELIQLGTDRRTDDAARARAERAT